MYIVDKNENKKQRVSKESILLSHICLSKAGVVEVDDRVVSQSRWGGVKVLTEHINNTLGSCNYKWFSRTHLDTMRYNNRYLRTETTRAIIIYNYCTSLSAI